MGYNYAFSGVGIQVAWPPRFTSAPLDIEMTPGTAWTLQAPNGGGKTTFLKTLLGLIPPFKGQFYQGKNPLDLEDPSHRRQLAYLGHGDSVPPESLVDHCLRQGIAMAQANPSDSLFQEMEALFQLTPLLKVPCGYLSRGQRQRVMLCRVALSGRSCWLLDEPLHHLDSQGKEAFQRALDQHLSQGGSAILTSPHGQISRLKLVPYQWGFGGF